MQRLAPKKEDVQEASEVEGTGVQDYERDLFMRIEDLMKDSRIYHQKDFTN